jgi:TrpR-related protein YerC/YecD
MEKKLFESAKELIKALLLLENEEECANFLEDICTVKEIQDLSLRLTVASELKKGKSYQDISKETGASTTTISRVNRSLNYGCDGYDMVFERLYKSDDDNL